VHHRIRRLPLLLAAAALLAACDSSEDGPLAGGSSFLTGTSSNPNVGVVLNSLSRSLTLFQVGDPAERREIALGASEAITPTGAAVRGRRVAVPLGNAAGVAVVSLATERVERVFTFPGGNATGAGWVDDETIVAANLLGDYVGRMRLSQGGASPPTQKPGRQPLTVPAALRAGVPFEPYRNWYGLPAASKAVPCSGPAVINPYLL
jgi:hypothetical protein